MNMQEQQAAERAAIVNFMGRIFGEARQLDKDMVQQSSTLSPTSHKAEQALRSYLQTQQPTVIPPTPQEIAGAGGQLPEHIQYVPPTPTNIPVEQVYTPTPVEPVFKEQVQHQNNDITFAICEKLDKIIYLLKQLIPTQQQVINENTD